MSAQGAGGSGGVLVSWRYVGYLQSYTFCGKKKLEVEYLAKSCSSGMHFLLHFFVPAVQLLHQCEVMSHLYESFHAGTSNNIWVFLWWLYIYSGAKFAYLLLYPHRLLQVG